MKNIALRRILAIKPYQAGKPIDEVKRELGLKKVIKLASNENPFGPSPKVLAAIRQAARGIHRYPDSGCFYLRRELAARLSCAENQLIFGNGSDEVILMTLRAFVEPGDEIIVAQPTFLMYTIGGQAVGATIKTVGLKDFRYDLAGMAQAVTPKTKVIIIGNPDNPAGTYISSEKLVIFLKNLRPDILVLFDEAYYEYVKAPDYPDTISLLPRFKNILVTRTFSKWYGLAGLRIGYGIAEPGIVDVLNRIREPFNINTIAQAAALACLRDRAYYRRVAKAVEDGRDYLYRGLREQGLSFVESSTNFILIDVKGEGKEVARALLKQGIIVRDMGFWGLKNYIRVTIGTDKENKAFLRALTRIFSVPSSQRRGKC